MVRPSRSAAHARETAKTAVSATVAQMIPAANGVASSVLEPIANWKMTIATRANRPIPMAVCFVRSSS